MLKIEMDRKTGIALFTPEGALSKNDFKEASGEVDEYLESHEQLNGLIIHTENFPGWESFGAMSKHLEFVKSHHRQLSHVALVTDSNFGTVAEKIAGHFVSAEVRHFPFRQILQAKNWIQNG